VGEVQDRGVGAENTFDFTDSDSAMAELASEFAYFA